MNQEAGAHHRKHDQSKRQLQNDALVAEQAVLGNAPAVQEQQGGQEKQEEAGR